MQDNLDFDTRVEHFLKKQMTEEEEAAFKKELSSDPEKLARAQTIALMIKQMKRGGKDEDIVNSLKQEDLSRYKSMIEGTFLSDFDEEVVRFLRGVMSEKEKNDFLAQLQSSKELQNRARTIALTVQQMKGSYKKSDMEIVGIIKNTSSDSFKKIIGVKPKRVKLVYKVVSIAASVLVVLGIGLHQYDIAKVKQLGNANYIVFDSDLTSRSSTDSNTTTILIHLFGLVERGDSLDYVVQHLETLISVKTGSEYEDYKNMIQWNQAIAYLKLGNKTKAVPLLKQIIKDNQGDPISEKAKVLLDKLDKIWPF